MNKIRFFSLLCLLAAAMPDAKAIITDPDDYIIYDTGCLSDSAYAVENFTTDPGSVRLFLSEHVTLCNCGIYVAGTPEQLGYPATMSSSALSGQNVWGLKIPQDNANENGPFQVGALEWKKKRGITEEQKTGYLWYYNQDINAYNRPSDSIVVRIPKDCDSIYIQGGGVAGYGYGLMVYEKALGRDESHFHWYGTDAGSIKKIGIRPTPIEGQDSLDIVILACFKDFFVKEAGNLWSDHGAYKAVQIWDGTNKYYKGQRWGIFMPININRIKVYGRIDKGEVPEFDGTVFGWTNLYRPKTSGTVDLSYQLTESDVETARYAKYASDLGIVRVLLTCSAEKGMTVGYDDASQRFCTAIDDLEADEVDGAGYAVKPDTMGYENGEFHRNWFQLSGTATGCQEMTLDFDFEIRNGNPMDCPDSIAVALQRQGDSEWVVLGFFRNAYDAATEEPQMSHVSLPLPDSIMANGKFSIRILPAYLENQKSALYISDLKVSGFNDWYEKDEDAPTVGYISNATDRIHLLNRATTADSSDIWLKSLMQSKNYRVKLFTQAETAGLDSEEAVKAAFADCDAVVLSEYPGSGADVVKNAKYLIGYKPFLNLKAFAYKNWGSGFTQNNGDNDSLAVIASNFLIHPLFNGISLTEQGEHLLTPSFFKDNSQTGKYFQGFTYTEEPSGYVIGRGVHSGIVNMYEDYSNDAAKYLMLAICADQNTNLNEEGLKLLDNALSYLLSAGHFEAPDFNLTTTGATVDNTAELKSALAYDFSVIGNTEPLILLKTSTDGDARYDLSQLVSAGRGKITLQPYDVHQSVVFKGSFQPTSLDLEKLLFKGVTFENGTPFKLGDNLQLSEGFFIEDCRFESLASLLEAKSDASSKIACISLKSSRLNQCATGGSLFCVEGIVADSLYIGENIFENCRPDTWIAWNSQNDLSQLVLKHNIFFQTAQAGASTLVALNASGHTALLDLSDNIFHQTGKTSLALDALGDSSELMARYNLFSDGLADWASDPSNMIPDDLSIGQLFADGIVLDLTSDLFTAGEGRSYLGARMAYATRTEPRTVSVSNVPELKTAIEIAIGGDVILLEDFYESPADTCDVYFLGSTGFAYPRTSGTIQIKAAEDAHPKLFGRITTNRSSRCDTLIYEGLTWVDSTWFEGYDKEAYNPFFFNCANDTVSGLFVIRNCQFYDQEVQVTLRSRAAAAGSYYGGIWVENCRFENNGGSLPDGKLGGHLFQLDASATYTLNRFTFINNVVSNFHGSQMFNLGRSGSTSDLNFSIRIDNNLFYKIGGNASDKLRSFLEFASVPSGSTVDISIANNIFCKRWSNVNYPVALLALYAADSTVTSDIRVTNNLFEGRYYTGDESLTANPVAPTNSTQNLALADSKGNMVEEDDNNLVAVNRSNDLYLYTMGLDHIFADESLLSISLQSPLYTAGLNGAPLGPEWLYVTVDGLSRNIEADKSQLYGWSDRQGQLNLHSAEGGQLQVCDLSGRVLYNAGIAAGTTSLNGFQTGLYIVRLDNAAAAVRVK